MILAAIAGVTFSMTGEQMESRSKIFKLSHYQSPRTFTRGTEVVMMDDFVMGTGEFLADDCSLSANGCAAASQTTPEAN